MVNKIKISTNFIIGAVLISIVKFIVFATDNHELIFSVNILYAIYSAMAVFIFIFSTFRYFFDTWGEWEKNKMKCYSVTCIIIILVFIIEQFIENLM